MRYLALAEIVELHVLIAKATGGAIGIPGLGDLGVGNCPTESHV